MRSTSLTDTDRARSTLHWAERRLSWAAEDVSRVLARGCTVAELQTAESRLCAARAEASEMRARLVDVLHRTASSVQPLPRGARSRAWREAAAAGLAPAKPSIPSAWCTGGVPELEQAFGDASWEAHRFSQEDEGVLDLRALEAVVAAWVAAKPRALRSAA